MTIISSFVCIFSFEKIEKDDCYDCVKITRFGWGKRKMGWTSWWSNVPSHLPSKQHWPIIIFLGPLQSGYHFVSQIYKDTY